MNALKYKTDEYLAQQLHFNRRKQNMHTTRANAIQDEIDRRKAVKDAKSVPPTNEG